MSFQRTSLGGLVEKSQLGNLRGALSRFSAAFRDGNGRMPTEAELRECLELVLAPQVQANAQEQAVLGALNPLAFDRPLFEQGEVG